MDPATISSEEGTLEPIRDRTPKIIVVWMGLATAGSALLFGSITVSFIVRTWGDFFSLFFFVPLIPVLVALFGLSLAVFRKIGWVETAVHFFLLFCATVITLLILAPILHFFAAYSNTSRVGSHRETNQQWATVVSPRGHQCGMPNPAVPADRNPRERGLRPLNSHR